MGVPQSHPPCGSLPAGFFPLGRVRVRRWRPPFGSAAPPTPPASTRRERGARPSQTPSSDNASSAHAYRRQGCVAAAPPRHGRLRPGRRLRARSATGNCPTMPDLDTATHERTVSVSGAPRQRSGAVRSCREGGSAFRLARKSESARSVVAVTEGRSGGPAEQDGRGRPCAAGRRGPPGARQSVDRAARRRSHRRRVRTGAATRRISVRGARGRSPSPAQCRTLGLLAPATY